MHLIDKAIRISYAKFIATDLQLYKIFKITSLIFWDTLYLPHLIGQGSGLAAKKNSAKIFATVFLREGLLCRRVYEKVATFYQ